MDVLKNKIVVILSLLVCTGPFSASAWGRPVSDDADPVVQLCSDPVIVGKLGVGWGPEEKIQGREARWIEAWEADLYFSLEQPADYVLSITAIPNFFRFRKQNAAIFINRKYAGEWEFDHTRKYQIKQLALPGNLLRSGNNQIIFRMGYLRRLSPSHREAGMGVNSIKLDVVR